MTGDTGDCHASCCLNHRIRKCFCKLVLKTWNISMSKIAKLKFKSWPLSLTWRHLHLPFTLQSCHIGEEDEGGEQEGEEPSFEVRQTEMVWGDQGRGHRGSQRRSNSPRSDHTRTSHSAHPPTHILSQHFFFFWSLSVFSHFLTYTSCLLPAMVDWPVHAFAGLCSTVKSILRTLFAFFFC